MTRPLPITNRVYCPRCGDVCEIMESDNPDSRPFRRTKDLNKGLCASCIVTHFLRSVESISMSMDRLGPDVLRNTAIRRQFLAILDAGNCEMPAQEINWERVIKNWELPFKRKYKL